MDLKVTVAQIIIPSFINYICSHICIFTFLMYFAYHQWSINIHGISVNEKINEICLSECIHIWFIYKGVEM